ncbi:alpha/beta fold hydrolase [Naumannella halotolerans]|uniref:alpha/beta fold hydrolase n=1 Tax=Naumannella halotolerans TaxID=993414 RepID=UPI00370DE185
MNTEPSAQPPLTKVRFGHGRPLLLAHGAGGSVADNFGQLARQLTDRELIGVDYPGSDASADSATGYGLDWLADQLVAAGVAAGRERFPVLGLSMGATVAVTAAHRHPERVSALVLTVGILRADAQAAAFARTYASLARAGRIDDLAHLLFLTSIAPAVLATMDADQARTAIADLADHHRVEGRRRSGQMDLVRSIDITAIAFQVAVPSLVVVAEQDRIVLPSSTRALGAAIPGAEVVEVAGAAHIFGPADTAAWAEMIDAFLGRHRL